MRINKCLALCMTMFLVGCSSGSYDTTASDVNDQIANVVQAEDPNVLGVKNGSPEAYPDKTYGEAFDNFFGSPTWKYFKGTQDGSDEDGDGKPDYTVDDVDVVEFTGYCTYSGVEVKALIQFVLNNDEGTFQATYLSFNDVPQNMLTLGVLLDTVFSENKDEQETEVETTPQTTTEQPKETTPKTTTTSVTTTTAEQTTEPKKEEPLSDDICKRYVAIDGYWDDEIGKMMVDGWMEAYVSIEGIPGEEESYTISIDVHEGTSDAVINSFFDFLVPSKKSDKIFLGSNSPYEFDFSNAGELEINYTGEYYDEHGIIGFYTVE